MGRDRGIGGMDVTPMMIGRVVRTARQRIDENLIGGRSGGGVRKSGETNLSSRRADLDSLDTSLNREGMILHPNMD